MKNLRVFSQNIWKNKFLTDILLEINKNFDIILIQESLWSNLCSIPSLLSEKGEKIVRAPNHPNLVTFSRTSSNDNDNPHVISYINICLISLCFSLWKDTFNYRDICCFYFFNNSNIFFLLNIYSDSNQSALKYLKNTGANICNVLIITGDFNIRNSDWDQNYSFHFVYSDLLLDVANAFNLFFSHHTHPFPTRYINNSENFNLVIDLIFLWPNYSPWTMIFFRLCSLSC